MNDVVCITEGKLQKKGVIIVFSSAEDRPFSGDWDVKLLDLLRELLGLFLFRSSSGGTLYFESDRSKLWCASVYLHYFSTVFEIHAVFF